jgi:hypothetical protein
MSEQFTTKLQLQLREAALREERRGSLGTRIAGVRYRMPGPGALAAAAVAAALVVAVIIAGGITWGGQQRTTVGPRVIADIPLSDNLNWLAPGFGSVWISNVHGMVLRVDPRTRAITQRIQVGGNDNAPGGTPMVNAGAGAVWAIARPTSLDSAGILVRIDPASGRITARNPMRMPGGHPLAIADIQILDGVPWVVGGGGSLQIDPATGRPVRFIKTELPAGQPYPLWVIGDDHNLTVLTRDQRILRYDLASGRLAGTLPAELPGAVGVIPTAKGPLLFDSTGDVALGSPINGRIAWKRQLGNSAFPYVLGDDVLVHSSDVNGGRDRLIKLDLATGDVRSSTGLPQFGLGAMAVVDRELWLTTPGGHLMILSR